MRLALTIQTPEVPGRVPVALLSGSLAEKLAKAAALGVQGVELITIDPLGRDRADLVDRLARYGLQAAAVASGGMATVAGLTLLKPDEHLARLAEQRLHELIFLAADIGAPLVTIGSFRGFAGKAGKTGRSRLAEILRRAGDLAGARGVKLAIEPLNRYESDLIHTAREGLAFLEELAHPAVGLLLDTYHMNIEEASRTEPFREASAAGKLLHVHLGDNNRRPPGRGMINFRAILHTLREIGYPGWLSAEHLALPDADAAARETVEYITSLGGV